MQMEIMLDSSPRALEEWRGRVAKSLAARPPLHDSTELSSYDLLRPPKSLALPFVEQHNLALRNKTWSLLAVHNVPL